MSSPYKLHVHSIVNSQISQHNNAGDLYTHATFLITQYPKVSTDFTLPKSKYFLDHVWNRRVARGRAGCNWVQCTHTPIWLHPQGICRISKTNMLISPPPPPKVTPYHIHMLPLLNRSFSKIYVHARCFVQCYRQYYTKCWFCGPDKAAFYARAYIYIHTHTQYMYTALHTHMKVCTYLTFTGPCIVILFL